MAALTPSRTPGWFLAAALLAAGGGLLAQIEGGDRGAAPIDTSNAFEVTGIAVDVAAKDAESARIAGWKIAQRKGWTMLAQRLRGAGGALPDGALDAIVTGIVVEDEQIGPTRYIAKLGVLFDRARAGAILGVATGVSRSAPMLVLPAMWSGGSGQMFERSTPWQEAWARFRTGGSTVDYVRPVGTGPDPLILNIGQTLRPGRGWWRTILDQYGANDVLIPEARVYRQWPGGPVIGVFTAYHGPDRRELARFTLRVETGDALPALLDAGVARLDQAYQDALASGQLQTDRLLAPIPIPGATPTDTATDAVDEVPVEEGAALTGTTMLSVQFETPGAAAVSAGEAALRSVPGVRSATTTSLALGGISVMRVVYQGDIAVLKTSLETRGWTVEGSGTSFRVRRGAAPPPAPAATATPAANGG